MEDLTAFQRDILVQLGKSDEELIGLDLKERLEEWYGEEVNHGRLYPNLDQLKEGGLIKKEERDRRSNFYMLTTAGRGVNESFKEEYENAT